MREDMQGQATPFIVLCGARLDVPHVVARAGEAGESALAIQEGVQSVGIQTSLAHQHEQDARVEVSASGPHHESLERSHSNACLDRPAMLHRACARAVAEMTGDDPEVADVRFERSRNLSGAPCVAGPVKAIAADAMLFGKFGRKGVVTRSAGEGCVEGGVEDRDVGNVGKERPGRPDAGCVGGIVQRSQGRQ